MNGTTRVRATLLRGGKPVGPGWKVIATQTTTSFGFPLQVVRAPSDFQFIPIVIPNNPIQPLPPPRVTVYVPAIVVPSVPPTIGTNYIIIISSNIALN